MLTRSITLQPGRELDLTLVPRKGQLRVVVRPSATVSVDGERLGATPLPTISLYEGPHSLELENSKLGVRRKVRAVVRADKEEVMKIYLQN